MTLQTKSPFPGCDPFLQSRWESCQAQMVISIGELMRGKLPNGLRPRIEARVYLEETDPDGHSARSNIKPDAFIVEYPKSYAPPAVGGTPVWDLEPTEGGVLIAEPITFSALPTEYQERYINIVDAHDGERIITSIELLSPANKTPGPGFDTFRAKQDKMLAGGVSLVEIDLIRGGLHAISAPYTTSDTGPDTHYRVSVLPSWKRDSGQLYALSLKHRLPVIDVPLRPTDAPLSLDLQHMHDIAYDRGEFAIDLNYRKEPTPPLPKKDTLWADQLLKANGLR
jgi:hypothetical protein